MQHNKKALISLAESIKKDLQKCHWTISNLGMKTGFLKQATERADKLINIINNLYEEDKNESN